MSTFIPQGPSTLFSNQQRLVLFVFQWIAAFLSTSSSASILYTLFADKEEKKSSPFQRILTASCCMDLCVSAPVVFMGGWGVPRDEWTNPWANGNLVTCNIMGIFVILGGAGQLLYSGALALYHLLTVRYNWRTERFAGNVEKYLHVVSLVVPIASAVLVFQTDYINSSHLDPGLCRASTNPPNCVHYDHLECKSGHEWKSAHLVLSITYISMAALVWTTLVTTHILIWLTVRATERRMMRYGHGSSRASSLFLTKKVGVQGMMYVGCFTSTNILSLIRIGVLYQLHETSWVNRRLYFWFQLFSLPLLQLQGFFQGIVFFRSRWRALLQPGRAWQWLSKHPPNERPDDSGNEDKTDPTGRTDNSPEEENHSDQIP